MPFGGVMENIEAILYITAVALGLLTSTITFVLKFWSSEKAKDAAEQTTQICNVILNYVAEAEMLASLNGQQKKSYVFGKVNEYIEENKMSFNIDEINNLIEGYINFSKIVNFKEN